jgi:CRISPR-associated endonuclease/helicase Cas3
MEYLSHLDRDDNGKIREQKRLLDHLSQVATAMQSAVMNLPQGVLWAHSLKDLAYYIGLCHDLGKYTTFFQSYLRHGTPAGDNKNHSLLSALWGAYIVSELTDFERCINDILITLTCIYSHHGHLESLDDVLMMVLMYQNPDQRFAMDPKWKRRLDVLFEQQITDLEKNKALIHQDLKNCPNIPDVESFLNAIAQPEHGFWDHLLSAMNLLKDWQNQGEANEFHRQVYFLFSCLIESDKRDAARLTSSKRFQIPQDIVTRFKQNTEFAKSNPLLQGIRNKLYSHLEDKVDTIDLSQRLYTLTAPTGSGKTLASLNFAIRLRHRILLECEYLPRIIYAMPFTTIIDQNYDILEKILNLHPQFASDASAFLLKHHHLAPVKYDSKQNQRIGLPLDQALLLIESWDSELIVTTFMQFFYSIVSNANRALKKFHNIAGSIVILDEIQNIPIEYWPLVRNVLDNLASFFHCYIILMTATQPLIFQSNEITELAPSPSMTFDKLDRVHFRYSPAPEAIVTFWETHQDALRKSSSVAIVANTIQASLELFHCFPDDWPAEIFYLSTNILPVHRLKIIKKIQTNLRNEIPTVLVSTQVIEAGVDLDFDWIIRDMAPVDSMVQSAGRANRHGIHGKSKVSIVEFIDEKSQAYCRWIYGAGHLKVARELLQNQCHFTERDFFQLVNDNYEQLTSLQDSGQGKAIFEKWWKSLDYSVLKEFKLIENYTDTRDIFIQVDDDAISVWNQWQKNVIKAPDFKSRQNASLQLKSEYRKYIMTIPRTLCKNFFWDYCDQDETKVGLIESDYVNDYYDFQTGFIREPRENTFIFI